MAAPRSKLTEAEKQRNRLIREANKRMRLLEGQGIKSPAYVAVVAKLKKLGVKGDYFSTAKRNVKSPKTAKQVEKLAKHFLSLPTSEITQAVKSEKKRKEKLREKFGVSIKNMELADTIFSYAKGKVTEDIFYELLQSLLDEESDYSLSELNLTEKQILDVWKEAFNQVYIPEEDSTPGFIGSQAKALAEIWLADAANFTIAWSNDEAVNEILKTVENPATGKLFTLAQNEKESDEQDQVF